MEEQHPDHWQMGPSSSSRWIPCPGSLAAIAQLELEEQESEAAKRGTLGHSMSEAILDETELSKEDKEYLDSFDLSDKLELELAVDECVQAVRVQLAKGFDHFLLETKIQDDTIPNHGGTVDVIIVKGFLLHIIDFKFGRLPVDAEGNFQLMCYMNLARQRFPHCTKFKMTILQPAQGGEDSVNVSFEDLEEHSCKVLEASVSEEFKAGDHCIFCPLMVTCESLAKHMVKQVSEFPDLTKFVNEVEEDIPNEKQLDLLSKIYQVHKIAKKASEGAASLLKTYHRKGAKLKGVNVYVTHRNYWKPDVTPQVVAMAENLGLEAFEVTVPITLAPVGEVQKALGMDMKTFRTEFRKVLDVKEIENIKAGKRGNQTDFPEFE